MGPAGQAGDQTPQYCRKCSKQIEADSLFCRHCGAPTGDQAVSPSAFAQTTSQPATLPKRRVKRVVVLVVSIAAVIAAVLVVLYVPIPHSFSISIPVAAGHGENKTYTFPTGSHVSGSWSTNNGAAAPWFMITTQLGGIIYQASGVSGSFWFTASYSTYVFGAGAGPTAFTVEVSGTYSSPIG